MPSADDLSAISTASRCAPAPARTPTSLGGGCAATSRGGHRRRLGRRSRGRRPRAGAGVAGDRRRRAVRPLAAARGAAPGRDRAGGAGARRAGQGLHRLDLHPGGAACRQGRRGCRRRPPARRRPPRRDRPRRPARGRRRARRADRRELRRARRGAGGDGVAAEGDRALQPRARPDAPVDVAEPLPAASTPPTTSATSKPPKRCCRSLLRDLRAAQPARSRRCSRSCSRTRASCTPSAAARRSRSPRCEEALAVAERHLGEGSEAALEARVALSNT